MSTKTTLDEVILSDGEVIAQTSQSQIQSNITIDIASIREKNEIKQHNRSRKPRGSHDRSSLGSKSDQPAMPKVSSFLSHVVPQDHIVKPTSFSKKDTALRVVPLG